MRLQTTAHSRLNSPDISSKLQLGRPWKQLFITGCSELILSINCPQQLQERGGATWRGAKYTKHFNVFSCEMSIKHLLDTEMLLSGGICCRTSLTDVQTDVLAFIGGLIILFYLLKFTWRCWCGLRQFVLSEHWQVDFRKYGQWAGNV